MWPTQGRKSFQNTQSSASPLTFPLNLDLLTLIVILGLEVFSRPFFFPRLAWYPSLLLHVHLHLVMHSFGHTFLRWNGKMLPFHSRYRGPTWPHPTAKPLVFGEEPLQWRFFVSGHQKAVFLSVQRRCHISVAKMYNQQSKVLLFKLAWQLWAWNITIVQVLLLLKISVLKSILGSCCKYMLKEK